MSAISELTNSPRGDGLNTVAVSSGGELLQLTAAPPQQRRSYQQDGGSLALPDSLPSARFKGGIKPQVDFHLHRRLRTLQEDERYPAFASPIPDEAEAELTIVTPDLLPKPDTASGYADEHKRDCSPLGDGSGVASNQLPAPDSRHRPAALSAFGLSWRIRHYGARHWSGQLEYGLRLGLALLVSGALIAFIDNIGETPVMPIPYIFVFMCLLATTSNVGQTLLIVLQLLQAAAVCTLIGFIELKAGLGLDKRWQAGLCIFLAECFGLYVFRAQPFGRKTAGAVLVIIPLLAANSPAFQDSHVAWKLLLEVVAALSLCSALMAVAFPRFARLEMHERWGHSARLVGACIHAVVDSYTAADHEELLTRRAALHALMAAAKANLAQLKARAGETRMEDAFVPRLYSTWPYYARYSAQRLAHIDPLLHATWAEEVLEQLDLVCVCVDSVSSDPYHAEFQDWMEEGLRTMAAAAVNMAGLACEVRVDAAELSRAQEDAARAWSGCMARCQQARRTIHNYEPAASESSEAAQVVANGDVAPPTPSTHSLPFSLMDVVNHCAFMTAMDILIAKLASRTLTATPPLSPLRAVLQRYAAVLFLLPYTYEIDWFQAWVSLKVAAIIVVVSLPWLIQPAVVHFDNGYWIPIAVAFSFADVYGSAVYTCLLRILGTTVGAVYGALVLNAVIQQDTTRLAGLSNARYGGVLALLFCFMLVCAPFRLHPKWSYAGTVAIFTAPIVPFAWASNGPAYLSPADFAIARIQENVLGCLLYLVLDYVLVPRKASAQLPLALSANLVLLQQTAMDSLTLYARRMDGSPSHPANGSPAVSVEKEKEELTSAALRARLGPAKASLASQQSLFPMALWEPPLPHAYCHRLSLYQPEVVASHQQLFELQQQLARLVSLLLQSLQRLEEHKAADVCAPPGVVEHMAALLAVIARLSQSNLLHNPAAADGAFERTQAQRDVLVRSIEYRVVRIRLAQIDAGVRTLQDTQEGRRPVAELRVFASLRCADYAAVLCIQKVVDVIHTAHRLQHIRSEAQLLGVDKH